MIIQVYVDDATERRLRKVAEEMDRTIECLAEAAVETAAMDAFRGRPLADDPGARSVMASPPRQRAPQDRWRPFQGVYRAMTKGYAGTEPVDNEHAIFIAEEAFRAGFAAAIGDAEYLKRHGSLPGIGEALVQKAWSAFEPSEAAKDHTA